jgi:hypothetical protein
MASAPLLFAAACNHRFCIDFGCNGFDVESAAVKGGARRERSADRAASCSAKSMLAATSK